MLPCRPRGQPVEDAHAVAGWKVNRNELPNLKMPCIFPLETQSSFLIPDCRRPGHVMSAVPLKLPAEAAAELQAAADQLGTSRTALGRTLVIEGLERLRQAGATRAA